MRLTKIIHPNFISHVRLKVSVFSVLPALSAINSCVLRTVCWHDFNPYQSSAAVTRFCSTHEDNAERGCMACIQVAVLVLSLNS